MERHFEIKYDKRVIKEDVQKIEKRALIQIKKAIEEKLTTKPQLFGKTLKNDLYGFRSLRVGKFRVIYEITPPKTVLIHIIEKRETVYKQAYIRLHK